MFNKILSITISLVVHSCLFGMASFYKVENVERVPPKLKKNFTVKMMSFDVSFPKVASGPVLQKTKNDIKTKKTPKRRRVYKTKKAPKRRRAKKSVVAPDVLKKGKGPKITSFDGEEGLKKAEQEKAPAPESSGGDLGSDKIAGGHGHANFDMAAYSRGIFKKLLSIRRYPRMARLMELEGDVRVDYNINASGVVVGEVSVRKSSGYDVLDEEAKRMIKAAQPFDPLPLNLKKTLKFTSLIRFELDNDEF